MRMVGNKGNNSGERVSPYLLLEPPTLRDACRALRRDDEGRLCASCCVREFCQRQASRATNFGVAD
jgi:hypothetical protein